MSNVAPRACAKAYELHLAGKHDEALKLAGKISRAEWAMGKGGILGTKVRPFRLITELEAEYRSVRCDLGK